MSHKGAPTSDKDTILCFAITRLNAVVEGQEKFEKSVKIIELIWQKTNRKIRDSVCGRAIESFQNFQREIGLSDIPAFKTVIQEMEEHKRVMDLNIELRLAIKSLNVNQVKAALENCGEDVKSVLEREVYWNGGGVDVFLIYPLKVKCSKELNQEDVKKIKEIFELMLGYASPSLPGFELNGNNYVMDKLTCAQERFAKIPGVGERCFQNLIQEFEEKLSKDTLDNAKTNDADLGQDNKTPENNGTNFCSEHKGKIALSVVGLCAAGAIAAYVLAYPAVAMALAVLAAVILMGAGIAKVLEDPSVEKQFTPQQGV